MHIKQIVVHNFRSFRASQADQDPGVNTLVGRNGTGKSNWLDALQFVLLTPPRLAHISALERQALLYEGAGSAAVQGHVELVLDNSDRRLALPECDADEVVIRRTIGLKKDECFVQSKRVSKQQVQSLLEGAGFSKSNPYYMVQQGKVQALCLMSDAERLALLQEVAGTTVYDNKKQESLHKMTENTNNRQQIDELLQDMQSRLSELEQEKEELQAYQKLDKQRRALEYTLYDKELSKARTLLDQLEQDRAAQLNDLQNLHQEGKATHDAIRASEATLQTLLNARRRQERIMATLEQDAVQAATRAAQQQVVYNEVQESVVSGASQLEQEQVELEQVNAAIAQAQSELDTTVQPRYSEVQAQLQVLLRRRTDTARQVQALYDKQGRGQQFATAQDRDTYLQSQIEQLEATKQDRQAVLQQQQTSLANLRRSTKDEQQNIQTAQAILDDLVNNQLPALHKNIDQDKRQRLELQQERQEAWRTAEATVDDLRQARENWHACTGDLRKRMPRATSMGLRALDERIVGEFDDIEVGRHYFGTVLDNIRLKDNKFQTAVEVAAQNALFHVIVDTDQTASRLMQRLERDKLGRVTFLPLNQLRVDQLPRDALANTTDVRLLLDLCIEFDPVVGKAMHQVFGKKLLAKSPQVAADWSARLRVDALTLDGDLVSRKGALTGGYVDTNTSRIQAYNALQAATVALRDLEREVSDKNEKAQQLEHSVSKITQRVQRLESELATLTSQQQRQELELERLQHRMSQHEKQAENIESSVIPPLEVEIATLTGDVDRLQTEIGTPLQATLTDEERALLAELKQEQTGLIEQIDTQNESVTQASLERQRLLSLLNDNLLKRRQELTHSNNETGTTTSTRLSNAAVHEQRQRELRDRQLDLDEAMRIKRDVDERLQTARQEDERNRTELVAAKNRLEQLKSQDQNYAKALEESQDKSERLLNKRTMCLSKRDTYARKIQELGSLPPPSEMEKYAGNTISELMKALENVNKKLKKYSHVNKKAFDQYVNFGEKREALLVRKAELDQGAEKVKELIESLDRQKDEAINRTFRGVSSYFKDVFQELVPNGAGELIMKTVMDETGGAAPSGGSSSQESGGSGEESQTRRAFDPNNPDVSLYRGVGIKVRFSPVGENYLMSQLSGGQKALVALALIFAIQRCDPAPFYIFDELDQALDSSYRAAVANLIQRQAHSKENPAQFIISTFRPELVSVADRCYGISLQDKQSRIHDLSKKDALHFIANAMKQEEALGEVTTVATSLSSRKRSLASSATSSRKRGQPSEEEEEASSVVVSD